MAPRYRCEELLGDVGILRVMGAWIRCYCFFVGGHEVSCPERESEREGGRGGKSPKGGRYGHRGGSSIWSYKQR
jgi:hypothetical protein